MVRGGKGYGCRIEPTVRPPSLCQYPGRDLSHWLALCRVTPAMDSGRVPEACGTPAQFGATGYDLMPEQRRASLMSQVSSTMALSPKAAWATIVLRHLPRPF